MGQAQKNALLGARTTETIFSEISNGMPAYPTEDCPNPWVSSISRWQDRKWFLDNPTPGARASASTIEWDIFFEDDTRWLDVCHADLLEEFRKLAWSLFTDRRGGKALKPGNALGLNIGLRELCQWMVRNCYAGMSELDSTASQRYLEDCQARLDGTTQEDPLEDLLNQNELEAIDMAELETIEKALPNTEQALQVTEGWVRMRLVVWRHMWDQRTAMHAAGVGPLPQEPFSGRKVLRLAKEMATKSAQRIPPLPDEVAVAIMNAANDYMEMAAHDVLRMVEEMLALRGTYKAYRFVTKRMRKWTFSTLSGSDQPWSPPLAEVRSPTGVLRMNRHDYRRHS